MVAGVGDGLATDGPKREPGKLCRALDIPNWNDLPDPAQFCCALVARNPDIECGEGAVVIARKPSELDFDYCSNF